MPWEVDGKYREIGEDMLYIPSNLTNKISSPNLLCPSGNQLVS